MTYKLSKSCDWNSILTNNNIILLFVFFVILNLLMIHHSHKKGKEYTHLNKKNTHPIYDANTYPYVFNANVDHHGNYPPNAIKSIGSCNTGTCNGHKVNEHHHKHPEHPEHHHKHPEHHHKHPEHHHKHPEHHHKQKHNHIHRIITHILVISIVLYLLNYYKIIDLNYDVTIDKLKGMFNK